jgi:hypothetical protein
MPRRNPTLARDAHRIHHLHRLNILPPLRVDNVMYKLTPSRLCLVSSGVFGECRVGGRKEERVVFEKKDDNERLSGLHGTL